MASCTSALSPSTSQHRVCTPVFCSEVHRDGLHGWTMLSLLGLRPQTRDRKHGCSVVQIISRGRWGSSLVPVMPSFKINAAVGDTSSPLHDGAEDGSEQTTKDHSPRRDGLLQWLKDTVARRSARKEEMVNNLKRYGLAGILSYGLLNTIYYLGTFLFVWLYVSPSPGGLGFGPAAQRFLKVFAAVWAGSQMTKLLRAAGALSLAPIVDRGLNWYTQRFNFNSRETAFSFLVGACFGLAALVFLVITTLWS
ncbi:unnamed protein product [Calypogeia fissa]